MRLKGLSSTSTAVRMVSKRNIKVKSSIFKPFYEQSNYRDYFQQGTEKMHVKI